MRASLRSLRDGYHFTQPWECVGTGTRVRHIATRELSACTKRLRWLPASKLQPR